MQPSSDRVGDARPPGRTVIQNSDLLVSPMLGEVIADDRPLPVVSAVHAKHIRAAFIGQLRAGRARADHKNLCLLVHLRCRDRGVRAPMPDDEDDAARLLACLLRRPPDQARRSRRPQETRPLGRGRRALALRSAAAIPAPRSNCSPNQAWLPVIAPATPIRMSACSRWSAECRNRDDTGKEQSAVDHWISPGLGEKIVCAPT